MGDRFDRVREIIAELHTLPATEASLEKALALVSEAITLLADEAQEMRGGRDSKPTGGIENVVGKKTEAPEVTADQPETKSDAPEEVSIERAQAASA